MKQEQKANALGELIYRSREAKGIATRKLAATLGLNESTLHRIQTGDIRRPRPDLLARFAEELDINIGELYALAGYRAEQELPDLAGWLNIKHRALPRQDVEALQSHLDYLVEKRSGDADAQRGASQ